MQILDLAGGFLHVGIDKHHGTGRKHKLPITRDFRGSHTPKAVELKFHYAGAVSLVVGVLEIVGNPRWQPVAKTSFPLQSVPTLRFRTDFSFPPGPG